MSVALLGVLGITLAVGVQMPQVWRSVARGRLAGLSFASVCIGTVSALAWLGWSLLDGDPWLAVSSAVYLAGGAAVTIRLLVERAPRPDWPLAGLWALVVGASVVASSQGVPALEVVLSAGSLVFGLPQVRAAWRSTDTTGISALSWAVYGLDGVVWLTYGLVAGSALPMWWGVATVTVVAGVFSGLARSSRRVSDDEGRPSSPVPLTLS
jgi:uncharacterized protein with PQ loop repeat